MLTLCAASFTRDHSRRERARSLLTLFKWPSHFATSEFFILFVFRSMWISPRRNAQSRGGLLELHLVRKACRVEDGHDSDVLRGAALRAWSGQWPICQREWRGSQWAYFPPPRVRITPSLVHWDRLGYYRNKSSFGISCFKVIKIVYCLYL